jgi:hypothetical protein
VQNHDEEVAQKGANPLAQMGLYKTNNGIFFAEWNDGKWVKYVDYTLAVPESDLWLPAPKDATSISSLDTLNRIAHDELR